MTDPPSETGATQEMVEALSSLEVAVTVVGASGTTATGVAELEAAEAIPVPAPFVALTVNV